MKHKSKVICWLTLFMTAFQLAAAESYIEVVGNRKTKTEYIQKLVNICLNNFKHEETSFDNLNKQLSLGAKKIALRRCINSYGLFSEVIIEVFNEERIKIRVKDKQSFLILPSYNQAQVREETSWGILILDFNSFGRGQLIGALFNRQEQERLDSYSFLYDAPFIDKEGKYGFSVTGFKRSQNFYSFIGSEWVYRVQEEFNFLWLRLKQRLTPKLSLTYGYSPSYLGFNNAFDNEDNEQIIAYPSQSLQTVTLNAEWNELIKRYYYEYGFRAGATLYQQLSNNGKNELDSVMVIELYAGVPSYKQHVFQWNMMAGIRNNARIYNSFRVGGEIGARGIPSDGLWSKHFLITGFDYQLPITQGRYGYWNIGPFIDLGYLWDAQHATDGNLQLSGGVSYYATGIASYVHLRQVNVPAFGLFYGTNSYLQEDYLSLYLGFRI